MSQTWCIYGREFENRRVSIYTDIDLRRHAPLSDMAHLVSLRLRLRCPKSDGLSSGEETEQLMEIEDALLDATESCACDSVYTGRCTGGGFREFYFYTGDGGVIETAIVSCLKGFSEYETRTRRSLDPGWSVYWENLAPTERDSHSIRNFQVVANLRQSGDETDVARGVSHWVYFSSESARELFVSAVAEGGFGVEERLDDSNSDEPYGVVVSRVESVEYWFINETVLTLFDVAERFSGRYDGWQTPVVRDRMGQ